MPVERVRIDVAYDGGAYSGWAKQPALPTVQGTMESVLAEMLRLAGSAVTPTLTCAGRTDAGVHARGQVAHVDLPAGAWRAWGAKGLIGQLNVGLPPDIRVRAAVTAPAGFDARFSALSRTYTYRICDDPTQIDPTSRGSVVFLPKSLDLAVMNRAGETLLGEHNFAAFCRHRPEASTVRRIHRLDWDRDTLDRARLTIKADAFCHSMVRSIVGALVAIGEGRRDVAWTRELIGMTIRHTDVKVMPPQGLVLEKVRYPPDDQLAAQAQAARRFRGSCQDTEPEPDGEQASV